MSQGLLRPPQALPLQVSCPGRKGDSGRSRGARTPLQLPPSKFILGLDPGPGFNPLAAPLVPDNARQGWAAMETPRGGRMPLPSHPAKASFPPRPLLPTGKPGAGSGSGAWQAGEHHLLEGSALLQAVAVPSIWCQTPPAGDRSSSTAVTWPSQHVQEQRNCSSRAKSCSSRDQRESQCKPVCSPAMINPFLGEPSLPKAIPAGMWQHGQDDV